MSDPTLQVARDLLLSLDPDDLLILLGDQEVRKAVRDAGHPERKLSLAHKDALATLRGHLAAQEVNGFEVIAAIFDGEPDIEIRWGWDTSRWDGNDFPSRTETPEVSAIVAGLAQLGWVVEPLERACSWDLTLVASETP